MGPGSLLCIRPRPSRVTARARGRSALVQLSRAMHVSQPVQAEESLSSRASGAQPSSWLLGSEQHGDSELSPDSLLQWAAPSAQSADTQQAAQPAWPVHSMPDAAGQPMWPASSAADSVQPTPAPQPGSQEALLAKKEDARRRNRIAMRKHRSKAKDAAAAEKQRVQSMEQRLEAMQAQIGATSSAAACRVKLKHQAELAWTCRALGGAEHRPSAARHLRARAQQQLAGQSGGERRGQLARSGAVQRPSCQAVSCVTSRNWSE